VSQEKQHKKTHTNTHKHTHTTHTHTHTHNTHTHTHTNTTCTHHTHTRAHKHHMHTPCTTHTHTHIHKHTQTHTHTHAHKPHTHTHTQTHTHTHIHHTHTHTHTTVADRTISVTRVAFVKLLHISTELTLKKIRKTQTSYRKLRFWLWMSKTRKSRVDCVWNVMAHEQKPDFVFRRNERVHLNRRGCQFSRILASEVCASAVVMLDTPCSEVVWRVVATHSIRQFPLHFPSHASPSAITFQLDSTYISILETWTV